MSFWIEIHCDVLNQGRDPDNVLLHRCHTHRNHNPGLLSQGLQNGYKNLKKIAVDQGWKHNKVGWVCPGCQKKG